VAISGQPYISGSNVSGGIIWGIGDGSSLGFQGEIYPALGAPDTPGTYDIDAAQAEYSTCDICMYVHNSGQFFMPVPDSGTITFVDYVIGEPVGTAFSGDFALEMREVTINTDTAVTTPVENGCTGALTATWSGTVEAG
jgi:hypothetical protein